ncbi:MAG: twin-arginine translocase TatA/TatE family subunit [Candidatus Coatesbacteria bacterium]|nr:MAG: twin-arginine translocase TatA/TatE family subunit [Candidatus Coatesbacteria bacterium]
MFGSIGIQEILLILLIALLLFGAKRLPEIGRGLGKGIREFKRTSKEISDQINEEAEDKEKAKNES